MVAPRKHRPLVRRVGVDDEATQKALDGVYSAIPDVGALEGIRLLENITFTSGETRRIPHGLGRKLRGYLIVRIDRGDAAGYHYDEQAEHADTDKFLYLRFEGISPVASLLVF